MKAVARKADPDTTPVSAVMTRQVLTIEPTASLHEAARHMATRWIRHLPVVDDGQVVGMVSQRDLCGVLAALAGDPEPHDMPTGALVREQRLARIEAGDLD
jgi:signal-transduction protein with cAMP-binding, CBS, and nucleotidyltransferase domain